MLYRVLIQFHLQDIGFCVSSLLYWRNFHSCGNYCHFLLLQNISKNKNLFSRRLPIRFWKIKSKDDIYSLFPLDLSENVEDNLSWVFARKLGFDAVLALSF